jgi:hypothetical protein|tara:strand:+ start:389 stop:652 length:264 start_codon:yes stop_codon:yes gene_type:complete
MTKKQKILNHLKSGKTITSMEAINLYGVTRLAAVVHTLKRERHPIESENVKGKNGNYAVYKMYFTGTHKYSQMAIDMVSCIGYRGEE